MPSPNRRPRSRDQSMAGLPPVDTAPPVRDRLRNLAQRGHGADTPVYRHGLQRAFHDGADAICYGLRRRQRRHPRRRHCRSDAPVQNGRDASAMGADRRFGGRDGFDPPGLMLRRGSPHTPPTKRVCGSCTAAPCHRCRVSGAAAQKQNFPWLLSRRSLCRCRPVLQRRISYFSQPVDNPATAALIRLSHA